MTGPVVLFPVEDRESYILQKVVGFLDGENGQCPKQQSRLLHMCVVLLS